MELDVICLDAIHIQKSSELNAFKLPSRDLPRSANLKPEE